MKKIENFVKHTFKDIPKEGKAEVIKTVTSILIEKIEDLIESGLPEKEMKKEVFKHFSEADIIISAAAVADFRPKEVFEGKIKKEKRQKTLTHYKNDLLFSGVGTVIIICILLYINLYFSPTLLWFVIPSIAILWWPLAILYNLLNKRENRKVDKDE